MPTSKFGVVLVLLAMLLPVAAYAQDDICSDVICEPGYFCDSLGKCSVEECSETKKCPMARQVCRNHKCYLPPIVTPLTPRLKRPPKVGGGPVTPLPVPETMPPMYPQNRQ